MKVREPLCSGALLIALTQYWGCSERATDAGAVPAEPIVTISGTGTAGFTGEGSAAGSAQLDTPVEVAVGPSGDLIVVDFNNHRVRQIDAETGVITTLAGSGEPSGPGALLQPTGITFGGAEYYVASWGAHRVFRYRGGERTAVVGTGERGCGDTVSGGDAAATAISWPRSVGLLADGSLLISVAGCRRVTMLAAEGGLAAFAGTGETGYGGDDGPAATATFGIGESDLSAVSVPPFGFALSPENPPDELFIADTDNHVIREVNLFNGTITTFAGTGDPGFDDGSPRLATFNRPTSLFVSADHTVWVVDSGNHAIRRIDPLQIEVTTVVGTGEAGYNGDRIAAAEAQLNHPGGVYVTDDGVMYIADSGNHRIRRVSLAGFGPGR